MKILVHLDIASQAPNNDCIAAALAIFQGYFNFLCAYPSPSLLGLIHVKTNLLKRKSGWS